MVEPLQCPVVRRILAPLLMHADAKRHDPYTLALSTGLCVGLVISYLPQVGRPSSITSIRAHTPASKNHPIRFV